MFVSCLSVRLTGMLKSPERQLKYFLKKLNLTEDEKKKIHVRLAESWEGDNENGLGVFTVRYHVIKIYSANTELLIKLEERIKSLNCFMKSAIREVSIEDNILLGGAEITSPFNPFLP